MQPSNLCASPLAEGSYLTGKPSLVFGAPALPSGIYFYRLTSSNFSAIKKMVLIK
jgi:hypothetical protein